ncbi:MAG: transcriptional repressor [Bacteroidales bacterium]|nr:transcriptional repressor [Bacteroidales bacterium]
MKNARNAYLCHMIRSNDIESFKEKLRKHGLKATAQRIAVHESMMRLGHASADRIAEDIAAEGQAKISAASVYNVLSDLSEIGIYQKRMSRTNKMFFDVNTLPHCHVYDCENDSYRDLVDEDLEMMVQNYLGSRKFRGYKVDGIDIQILVRPSSRKKRG